MRISVTDTGPGIDRKHGDSIFEPYNRLGREGRGIGFAAYVTKPINIEETLRTIREVLAATKKSSD